MTEPKLPPTELGYRLGRSVRPRGVKLWSRLDRSTRVIGPMGSAKTARLLAPALRETPGSALATSFDTDLYELTVMPRRLRGPVVAMDPLGIIPGAAPLRWSPIHGAVDPQVAQTRARAFIAAGAPSGNGDGAVFHRRRAGSLLMCLLHAAALDGARLRDVLAWAANPQDPAALHILASHPEAAPGWADKLLGLTGGDDRMLANTLACLELGLSPFDHAAVRAACDVPAERCTDLTAMITASGTVYAVGKDSIYASIAPLITAMAEDVLDAADALGRSAPIGRLDPPFLAVLDEAPKLTPIPSLRQRLADGRKTGMAVIYGTQSWASVIDRWGLAEASELASATATTVVYGGCKDPVFLLDLERVCGQTRVTTRIHHRPRDSDGKARRGSTTVAQTWEPVLRAHQIAALDPGRGHALILAENLPPVIAAQPSLQQQPKLWRRITVEVEAVRAENKVATREETPQIEPKTPDGPAELAQPAEPAEPRGRLTPLQRNAQQGVDTPGNHSGR